MPSVVVLCPLNVERRAIAKRLRDRAEVRVAGPGAEAITAAVRSLGGSRPALVILFGLAGGLREGEVAPRIGRVVDKDGRSWTPSVISPGLSAPATIVGVDEPVLHPARKKQMAKAYAASLVDTESHAFAAAAHAAGLRWAVVRGVSDGPDTALPAAVSEWVDATGRTRLGRILLAAILNPGVIPAAVALARRARPALRAASDRLIELLNAEQAGVAEQAQDRTEVHVVAPGRVSTDPRFTNPIELQLGRKSARTNDPPPAPARKP